MGKNGGRSGAHPPEEGRDWLDDDLDSEWNVECFARTEAGCAVEVADSVGDGAVAVYRANSGRHVDTVKKIEHVSAKLSFQTLAEERDVLNDREIHAAEAGAVKLV